MKILCIFFFCLGIQILSLLVPVLINYLQDPTTSRSSTTVGIVVGISNKFQQQLHEFSLQLLLKIGPKYAQEFRAIMGQSLDLRQKLELAIRGQQQQQQQQLEQQTSIGGSSYTHHHSSTTNNRGPMMIGGSNLDKHEPKPPTIQLKTNFSNFH